MPGPAVLQAQALAALAAGDAGALEKKLKHPRWAWGAINAHDWLAAALPHPQALALLDTLAAGGFDVAVQRRGSRTPLLLQAHREKRLDVFEWLLRQGHSPTARAYDGGPTLASYLVSFYQEGTAGKWISALGRHLDPQEPSGGVLSLWGSYELLSTAPEAILAAVEDAIACGLPMRTPSDMVSGRLAQELERDHPKLFTAFHTWMVRRLENALPAAAAGQVRPRL